MSERTTVRLPEELIRRAKKRAAAEGRTMTALVEAGLRRELAERSAKAEPDIVLPPVSTASGAPLSGSEHAEIQRLKLIDELDDIEYVARLNRGFR